MSLFAAVEVGDSLQQALDSFFGFLPNLLGFLVILLVGYLVARLVSKAVQKLLERLGIDRRLHESDANRYIETVMSGARPSRGIARVVFLLVFAFFLFSAIGALGVPALTTFMNEVLAYLPNVIVAIVIFVLAAIIAGAVTAGVTRVMGDTPTGKIVATVVPALVMIIAMFMILEQLKVAEEIVRIAFAATMFALALGLALAFGLGGRDLAGRLLEDAYRRGKEEKDQVREDLRTGRDRAGSSASGGSAYAGSSGSPYDQTADPGATRQWSDPDQRY